MNARVGHHAVEFAVAFDGRGHGALEVLAAAGIAQNEERPRLLGKLLTVFGIDVHKGDVPARGQKFAHARRTDAGRPAGDKNILFVV